MSKIKEFIFDVEYIHDFDIAFMGKSQNVSSHKIVRGLTLKELVELIKLNQVPIKDDEQNHKITLIIRGVNF